MKPPKSSEVALLRLAEQAEHIGHTSETAHFNSSVRVHPHDVDSTTIVVRGLQTAVHPMTRIPQELPVDLTLERKQLADGTMTIADVTSETLPLDEERPDSDTNAKILVAGAMALGNSLELRIRS